MLRAEIAAHGPMAFRRFMDVALYHPEFGYYRGARDPFGVRGDFYTASQVQPVFGRLVAAVVRALPAPQGFTVVELGAGRGEMREFFAGWDYVPVDIGDEMPESFCGVVFANEFFDALPVDVVVRRGDRFLERLVDWSRERFAWIDGGPVSEEVADHLARYGAPLEDGGVVEVCLEARRVIGQLARRMTAGSLIAIDYGYTARELIRFPAGTLMSYRRHQALDDVLADPGARDITAHVNFTALAAHAADAGFQVEPLESMTSFLLRAGERDQFEEALRAATEAESFSRRMQLKTLLYGMGETFRVLRAHRSLAVPAL